MTSLVIDNREGKIINLIKHLTTDYCRTIKHWRFFN